MNDSTTPSSEADNDLWYYLDENRQTVGPMSYQVLLELAKTGTVKSTTQIAKGGSDRWCTGAELLEKLPPPLPFEDRSVSKPSIPSSQIRTMYCSNCGKQISDQAVICVHCGAPANAAFLDARRLNPNGAKSRLIFVLLGIFFGVFGVHNFYTGFTGKAIVQLGISLVLGWFLLPIPIIYIWAIIEVIVEKKDARGIPMI